jgi:tRNA U34 5-methylaminomethyl-2-thiouridine-forming methyltransferase MnmC
MNNIEIITTSDGSHSLLNTTLNETYHSHHGAVQESLHVFIDKGLRFFLERSSSTSVNIFEVGFGTGLNAFLTLQYALTNPDINFLYISIESFPLTAEVWSQLNYAPLAEDKKFFEQLHQAEWNKPVDILPNFKLFKHHTTLQEIDLITKYDVVYFDAFAPNKQPEMWELPVLQKVVAGMTPHGVFVTYCAKGQLKRDLKSLGTTVETLEGPPGKKEMVRALQSQSSVS